MSDLYLDADWTPAELEERERMAEEYSRRCYVSRRARVRRFGTMVSGRCLALFCFSCGSVCWPC